MDECQELVENFAKLDLDDNNNSDKMEIKNHDVKLDILIDNRIDQIDKQSEKKVFSKYYVEKKVN